MPTKLTREKHEELAAPLNGNAIDSAREQGRQEERARSSAIIREHGTGYADRTEFLAREIESGD